MMDNNYLETVSLNKVISFVSLSPLPPLPPPFCFCMFVTFVYVYVLQSIAEF